MKKKIGHKFGAIRSMQDGINFPSRLEARYYQYLKEQQEKGELVMFLRQPLFDLPGRVTYRADFIEFWKDGSVKVVDVKGMPESTLFLAKKKMVESLYPVEIEVMKKVPK